MALVTVSGVISDASGAFPTSGFIQFSLTDQIEDGTAIRASGPVKGAISSSDGTFSVSLESTLPTGAEYTIVINATFGGGNFIVNWGNFKIGALPANQNLSDITNFDFGDPYVTGEAPTGAIDGFNLIFTLANPQACGTERVYDNGILLDSEDPGGPALYNIDDDGRIVLKRLPTGIVMVDYLRADTYDPSTGNRVFREAMAPVAGDTTSYLFAYPPEGGTEEVYIKGELQIPEIQYIIQDVNGVMRAVFTQAPAFQPYAWYVKGAIC